MKITTFMLFVCFMQLSAKVHSQINIKERNVPITSVLAKIQQQSGYNLFYENTNIKDVKINVSLSNVSLKDALEKVLKDQALSYTLVDKTIIIKIKAPSFLEKVVDAFTPPIDVSGFVSDEKGMPLPGATVKVKGLNYTTTTDANGKFHLSDLAESAILTVTYIGYQEVEIQVKTILNISLKLKSSELQEVVVAYGKQEQKAITGAVQVLSGKEIENLPNRSFDKSLMGLVPGLLVTPGSGQPGSGISNFVLRGISTAANPTDGSTVRNPLIIIDGVPITQDRVQLLGAQSVYFGSNVLNPLSQLNPSDIETMSVLKDASAIALYGSKASNGVILITTKRGKAGRTQFNFRHQTDIAQAINGKTDYLNQEEYLELLYETYKNTPRVVDGVPTPWTDAAITNDLKAKFPVKSDGSFYSQPDWTKELYNDQAVTISNELSMTGGTEKSNFYLNLEYTKQDGVIKKTGYDRKSLRFNFENRPADWFKVGMNSALSYNVQDYGASTKGPGSDSDAGGATSIFQISPLNPIRLENGEYLLNFNTGAGTRSPAVLNPAAAAAYNSNVNTAFRGLTHLNMEFSAIKHLTFTTNNGVDFGFNEAREYVDPRLVDPGSFTIGGRIEEQNIRQSNLISTNTLRYSNVFNAIHNLELLAGQEAQILYRKTLGVGVKGLISPYYDQISSPGVTVLDLPNGFVNKETLMSYFGQLNYGYKGRYFLTASIRRDGSSRFGADKRYGTYWSTGLGYVLTEENWMKNNLSWVNYLKLRGSIGAAGNAGAIDRYTPYDQLQIADYGPYRGVNITIAGNPDVKWEQTFTWDAGIELKLINDRIGITADVYKKKTSNLIYTVQLPLTSGFASQLGNIGKMRNQGVEVSVTTDVIKNDRFSWNLSANWSTNKNVLVKADVPLLTNVTNGLANKEGDNFNSFYLIRWAGVNPTNGSAQYYDKEENISTNRSGINRVLVGKPQPDGFGAFGSRFSYNHFDLAILFYYQYGFQIYNDGNTVEDGANPYRNQSKAALNRWQKPGDIAVNPKPVLNNPLNPQVNLSTRNLYDGDYVRLQNLTIGYNFPKEIYSRLNLKGIRLYAQGNNLGIWTKYNERDPSTVSVFGLSHVIYPAAKTYSLGANIIF